MLGLQLYVYNRTRVFGEGGGVHSEIFRRSDNKRDENDEDEEHEHELDDPEGYQNSLEPWCGVRGWHCILSKRKRQWRALNQPCAQGLEAINLFEDSTLPNDGKINRNESRSEEQKRQANRLNGNPWRRSNMAGLNPDPTSGWDRYRR